MQVAQAVRNAFSAGLMAAAVLCQHSAVASPAANGQQIQNALDVAYAKVSRVKEGKNADYIPALAKVDPKIFGVALVTTDGKVFTVGDVRSEVSIQSISKVFTAALVMDQRSPDALEKNVGVDATGQAFNSIVAIEQYKGAEMNPLVNPGAISATSMVSGANRNAVWNNILKFYSDFAGRPLSVNNEVFSSEAATNQRNQAIAALMRAYGKIKGNAEEATDIYTEQCSVSANAKDLAIMAATLANGGTNPVTGKVAMKAENVPEVLAIMATAGLYDDSGKWLFRTGLPAKSGVGGGIIAVAPGKFGIAAISPPLDAAGNSVKAQRVIEAVVDTLRANPYRVTPNKPAHAI